MDCYNKILSIVFYYAKNILLLLNIIVPIILIISLVFNLFLLVKDPEDKKLKKKVKNSFLSVLYFFFIPLFINALLALIDTNFNITSCLKNATKVSVTPTYKAISEQEKKSIIPDMSYYENGKSGYEKIADLAVALSPTASPEAHLREPNAYPWNKINDWRLFNFYDVMDATIGKYGDNNAYASCVQAAGGIIRATVDPDIAVGGPSSMLRYLQQNTDKWKLVKVVPGGTKFDSVCKPGDLLVTATKSGGHAMIYVGHKKTKSKFPNSDGNMFQAAYGGSGTYALYPSIDNVSSDGRTFNLFRPTGSGNFKHPFINIDKYVK